MHLGEISWASYWNLIELQWNPSAISVKSQWNQNEPQCNVSEIWMHPQAGYDVLRIFAPRVTAWRSSGRGIIQDTHTHSHKNEKQIEEGKERKVSSKVCPLGFSSPPRSHLWILPLLVFICSSTSSLGQFWEYIRLKRHGPTLWQWHNWASVVEPLSLTQMACAPWQEGAPKKHKST